MGYRLTLREYKLNRESKNIQLKGNVPRVVYVLEGTTLVREGSANLCRLQLNSAMYSNEPLDIYLSGIKSIILIWELLGDSNLSGDYVSPVYNEVSKKLEAEINLDIEDKYVIRCDRVDFPLGGIAYTHTHKGPGIRYLLSGSLDVMVGGITSHMAPKQAWFETGPEHVYAVASETCSTSFVRVMVLPNSIKGLKSIEYVLQDDKDKPKLQQYTMFVDTELFIK